jgi:amidase
MIAFEDYARLGAARMALLVGKRELSPVELVETAIQAIETRNPSLNAIVISGFDEARRRAQEAEAAVMRGEQARRLSTACRSP